MEFAATGGNLYLFGPSGAGKTMLAKRDCLINRHGTAVFSNQGLRQVLRNFQKHCRPLKDLKTFAVAI